MLLLLSPFLAAAEEAHEKHLKIDELPAAVKTAVLKLANGTKVDDIESESNKGKVVYKVKIGKKEITLHPSGRVLRMKTERTESENKTGKGSEESEEKGGKKDKEHDRN